jgi:hypothetical protein
MTILSARYSRTRQQRQPEPAYLPQASEARNLSSLVPRHLRGAQSTPAVAIEAVLLFH